MTSAYSISSEYPVDALVQVAVLIMSPTMRFSSQSKPTLRRPESFWLRSIWWPRRSTVIMQYQGCHHRPLLWHHSDPYTSTTKISKYKSQQSMVICVRSNRSCIRSVVERQAGRYLGSHLGLTRGAAWNGKSSLNITALEHRFKILPVRHGRATSRRSATSPTGWH